MNNAEQKSAYQTVKNYILGTGLALAITLTPNIALARNHEAAPGKKDGIENVLNGAGKAVGNYLEKADNYPTLDQLSREKKLNLGTGLEYTTLLPGSYVVTFSKPIKGVVADAPKEAMNRADAKRKSEKRLLKKAYQDKEEKGIAAILAFLLRGAWNSVGDVIELGRDVSCFTENYIWVTGEGTVKYIIEGVEYTVKNPADFSVKTGTAVLIGKIWSDAAHRREHHVKGGGEESPFQPAYPDARPGGGGGQF